jgi:hypothetical protein
MKKLIILALVTLVVLPLKSQRFRGLRSMEARLGVGMCNTLSELGGANRIGTHFYRDYELIMTRPAFNLGLRYIQPQTHWAYMFNITYARVAGRDNLTQDIYRQNRNLNFRSYILEFEVHSEYHFRIQRPGHHYEIREVVGQKSYDFDWYLFGGIGCFWFNPKGQYNRNWYALQPLNTEGQTLLPTRKKYHRFTGCVPFGIGTRYAIDNKKRIHVGFEAGFRYTFTDYLDDVSTTYVQPAVIINAHGPIAAALADPSLGTVPGQTTAGEQRGDPRYNDVYMTMLFNVNVMIMDESGRRPKFFTWASRF